MGLEGLDGDAGRSVELCDRFSFLGGRCSSPSIPSAGGVAVWESTLAERALLGTWMPKSVRETDLRRVLYGMTGSGVLLEVVVVIARIAVEGDFWSQGRKAESFVCRKSIRAAASGMPGYCRQGAG
jgi:hypothetical protein